MWWRICSRSASIRRRTSEGASRPRVRAWWDFAVTGLPSARGAGLLGPCLAQDLRPLRGLLPCLRRTSGRPLARGGLLPDRALTAGHCGDDRHLRAVRERRPEPAEEPDVALVDEDVDEPQHLALLVDDPRAKTGEPPVQLVERLPQVGPADLDQPLAVRQLAQRRRNPYTYRHEHAPFIQRLSIATYAGTACSTRSSNEASVGLIRTGASSRDSTASSAFNPMPVM